ncbi:MAG: hypothetical protein IPN71_00390 [Fibrobacteres bacterium]|jgi:hypothetical protein|nr:hypothetical protein [Fibrobacterota bacterium]
MTGIDMWSYRERIVRLREPVLGGGGHPELGIDGGGGEFYRCLTWH